MGGGRGNSWGKAACKWGEGNWGKKGRKTNERNKEEEEKYWNRKMRCKIPHRLYIYIYIYIKGRHREKTNKQAVSWGVEWQTRERRKLGRERNKEKKKRASTTEKEKKRREIG